jgi:N6-adenosine-specific RNA methylase IME4
MQKRRIADIRIGSTRHRKDMGDIAGLAASIEAVGLLHAPVIKPDGTLVAGQRRIEAAKAIGWDLIPVHVVTNLDEAEKFLTAEMDENTCRQDFLPSEAVSAAAAIRAVLEPLAKKAQADGGKEGGKSSGRGRKKNRGRANYPKPKQDESARTSNSAAKKVGMSRRSLEKAEAVMASGDEKLIGEMDKTGKVNGAFKKLQVCKAAEQIAAEPPPLPTGPFRVIVADPPWRYSARPDDPTHRAANPYPTMTVEEISALDVASRATEDAILWLWTTNAFLHAAFHIAEAWGFVVKTCLTWVKDRMGTGDWLRGQTEHCLLCVRGKPTIVLTNQTTVLYAPMRKHSQKPEEFYALVEALCPGSKLEMFQRTARPGWIGHGNEAAYGGQLGAAA